MTNRETITTALMTLLTSSIAVTFTGQPAYGSAAITGIATTAGLFVGMPLSADCLPIGITIASIDSTSQITASAASTQSGARQTFTTGFRTTGRRLKLWTEVAEQPALFLRNTRDDYAQRPTGIPARVTMNCEAWLYSNAGGNPDIAPAITLNYLVDALERALLPAGGQDAQTLGGLVQHCWIEGSVEMHPGDLDGQAIAIVPIKILVPTLA